MVAPSTTNVDISHEIGEKILYSTENLKTFTIKKADLAVQIPKAKEVLPSTSTTGKLANCLHNIDPHSPTVCAKNSDFGKLQQESLL